LREGFFFMETGVGDTAYGKRDRPIAINGDFIELPSKPQILAVDDDASIRRLISDILRQWDYGCDTAESVGQAIRLLNERFMDILFLDLGLPDGSGFTILDRAIESNPDIIVIVTTGLHDLDTAVKAVRKGAFDFITKPFSVTLFQERLKTYIEEWKTRTFAFYYQHYLTRLVEQNTSKLLTTESEIRHVYDVTVHALGAALDLRDPETEEHCRRVSRNSIHLGERLGLEVGSLRDLKWGAYLHDIGKIGIPEMILQKAGGLTDEEFHIIQKHTTLGYSMLKKIDFLKDASVLVLQHHEKYDGTGYPLGLKGGGIHRYARIFAIVDAYDAMVFTRPYREAMSAGLAREEILRCRGTHFDPELVDLFLELPESLILTA
jgi:putative nucleotidyltransferase with HDIG domain